MSIKFRVVFACACAVLAVMVSALYADHVKDEADRVRTEALERYGGEVVSVVVATEGLEAGDVVSETNVEVADWVADLVPEGAVTSLDDIEGLQVTVPLAAGEPVTELNFRDSTTIAEVPSGCVALTVPVTDKLGVPRTITVGSALVAYEAGDAGAVPLAAGIEVLATPATTATGSSVTLTIAVPADYVADVIYASAEGSLRLVVPAADVDELPGTTVEEAPTSVPQEGEKNDG